MRITNTQLRKLIREEYDRVTPTRPGQLMTEARANYLAEELLDEGLFDNIKALFAGGAAAAKSVGGKAAGAAGKAASALGSAAAGAA